MLSLSIRISGALDLLPMIVNFFHVSVTAQCHGKYANPAAVGHTATQTAGCFHLVLQHSSVSIRSVDPRFLYKQLSVGAEARLACIPREKDREDNIQKMMAIL